MANFKHILFPVDFSPQNCGIAPYVASMANRYRARVTILHVMEVPTGAYPGWPAHAALMSFETLINERKQRVEAFLRNEFQGVSTTRQMNEGDPAQVIAELVEQDGVDLIMMPTHGYGPFRRFILGSVTAKVLHDVKCPVWTSAHAQQVPPPPNGYRTVLCALDLTAKSLPLLQWAAGFTREQGARLKLVHAVPAVEPRAAIDIEGERFRAFLFDEARQGLAKLQQEAGTKAETIVEGGDVARVVHQAAQEHTADLVVIGRGVMQELFGRMRTHVYSVIREAPCPVISV
jgi:nucleotide-binding universal stress UspA family protein